jgi:hypothetical protein
MAQHNATQLRIVIAQAAVFIHADSSAESPPNPANIRNVDPAAYPQGGAK